MLTKEAIMDYALEHFKMQGFKVNIEDKSSDIVFEKDEEVFKVVALAAVNNSESACIKGKGFNKQQVKINLASAIYEISRQLTASQSKGEKYILLIPETKVYARIVKEVYVGLKKLGVDVLVISDVGFVSPY